MGGSSNTTTATSGGGGGGKDKAKGSAVSFTEGKEVLAYHGQLLYEAKPVVFLHGGPGLARRPATIDSLIQSSTGSCCSTKEALARALSMFV